MKRIFWLILILLFAAVLRIVRITESPGLQHDEVFTAHDALTVQQGDFKLWFASNAGNEPLFTYILALSTALIGQNALAIRLPAAFCGILTVAFAYRWAWIAFGRRTALIAALMLAVSFWPVWMSRVGLRAVTLPPLAALTGWLYARALIKDGRRRFLIAGCALGLSLYTYAAALALPLGFAAFYVYLLVFRRDVLRRGKAGHLLFWCAAIVSYLPLGLSLAGVEGGYLRVQQTGVALRALSEGDLGPLLEGVRSVLLMWTHTGDPTWRYNVAGRPVFNLALGIIFWLGLIVCGWRAVRKKRPNGVLVLAIFAAGLAPSAVTDQPPAFLRAGAALPAAFIMLAVGFERVAWGVWQGKEGLKAGLAILVAGLIAAETIGLYFGVWLPDAEVQRAYRSDLAEVAAYLRTIQASIAISTTEPNHLDPFILAYTPHGGPRDIRWFDGLYGIVAPSAENGGPAQIIITREPAPDPHLQAAYLDHLDLLEERRFDNGTLAYKVYAVPPGDAFFIAFPPPTDQGAWWAESLAFPPDDPQKIRVPLDLPIRFGDHAELAGYASGAEACLGTALPLTLYWRVTQDVTGPESWAIFAHLLTPEGELVVGRDFLTFPAAHWREGDVFVQIHDLWLDPAKITPGTYHLEIGLYSRANGYRFPIMENGEPVSDRLLLEPVTILSCD